MEPSRCVSPGDPLIPESAARYNALSDSLNSIGHLGPRSPEVSSGEGGAVITCFNAGQQLLTAGSFVTVGALKRSTPSSEMSTWIYEMRAGINSPCGILLADCRPAETAEVRLAGLCEGITSPSPAGVVRIGNSPFSGSFRTLYLLGSSGDGYNNYFKVVPYTIEEGKVTEVRIIDGARPDSGTAGLTDIYEIRSGTLATENKPYVCLTMDEKYQHSFEMRSQIPDENTPCVILAEIINGTVIQRWTGGRIYWRNRFVIPMGGGSF